MGSIHGWSGSPLTCILRAAESKKRKFSSKPFSIAVDFSVHYFEIILRYGYDGIQKIRYLHWLVVMLFHVKLRGNVRLPVLVLTVAPSSSLPKVVIVSTHKF